MKTSNQVNGQNKKIPNPTGKGGFKERPQDINTKGFWDSTMSISYQYKRFLKMTPEQLEQYKSLPDNEKTVAMEIACAQVKSSKRSLPHAREVTDRTEGKAQQSIDLTTDGESFIPLTVQIIDGKQDITSEGV